MRSDSEIRKMFKEMDLDTEQKRSKFKFSYGYSAEGEYQVVPYIRTDTRTKELKEESNAELE
jgi:hypothetical protein